MVDRIKIPSYHQGFARSAAESKHPNLWRGLVGAYVPNLGNTGRQLFDPSPYKNHGIIASGITWVIDKHGRSLFSNTITDPIICGNGPGLSDLFSKSATILVSASHDSTSSTRGLVDKNPDNVKFCTMIMQAAGTGNIQVDIDDDVTKRTLLTVDLGFEDSVKRDIVFIKQGSAATYLYVDGKLEDSEGGAGDCSNSANLRIGDSTDSAWRGNIYYAYFWNRALTASEVELLYVHPYALFELADVPISFVTVVADIFPDRWHPGIELPYPYKKEVNNY